MEDSAREEPGEAGEEPDRPQQGGTYGVTRAPGLGAGTSIRKKSEAGIRVSRRDCLATQEYGRTRCPHEGPGEAMNRSCVDASGIG
eukprot:8530190-Heterocapsa_arctica.AAC.1